MIRLHFLQATVLFVSNNTKKRITLSGQGESYTRTNVFLGPGLSSFLPVENNRKIFLSTESIVLKSMFAHSNVKSIFCLYNNSDEDITYEWKEYVVKFFTRFRGLHTFFFSKC